MELAAAGVQVEVAVSGLRSLGDRLYAQEIEPHTGWHLGTSPRFSDLALTNACVHPIREDERIAAE